MCLTSTLSLNMDTPLLYTPPDKHTVPLTRSGKAGKLTECNRKVCWAIHKCAFVDWVRGGGPDDVVVDILISVNTPRIARHELACHPQLARFLAVTLEFAVDLDDLPAVIAFCIDWLAGPKGKSKIKLLSNRYHSALHRAKILEQSGKAGTIVAEAEQMSSVCNELNVQMMRASRERAFASYTERRGIDVVDAPPCMCGDGTSVLWVLRRSRMVQDKAKTAGGGQILPMRFDAPRACVWAACGDGIAVSMSTDEFGVSTLTFMSLDVYGQTMVPLVSTATIDGADLPTIASIVTVHGFVFMSHDGAITRSPLARRMCGDRTIKRAAMQVPGMYTLVSAHEGHTVVWVSTNGVGIWADATAIGTRRIVLTSFIEGEPVVRPAAGEPVVSQASWRAGHRASDSYTLPGHKESLVCSWRDVMPVWSAPSRPIPAVMCLDSNSLYWQNNKTVYHMHIPFIASVGSYDPDWTTHTWGDVAGRLLCAGRRPDGVVVLTTKGVYVHSKFVELPECASAVIVSSYHDAHLRVMRDGVVVDVPVPHDEPDLKRARSA